MHVAFAPIYKYELPSGHRFPMEKYELLPIQLLREGVLDQSEFFHPSRLTVDHLTLTHSPAYWQKLEQQDLSRKEIRSSGFPMTGLLVERGRYIAQGTYECAQYADREGISLNIAGGTHHAYADRGEGFCVFNDIAIAARMLLHEGRYRKIMVIDLDVHQGNGTAHIFRGDPGVFTFSMHGLKNYPLRKERSDLDIGLPDHTTDLEYLSELKTQLPRIIDRFRPELVFYQAGVDVLKEDKLGRLDLSLEGCLARDHEVLSLCYSLGIPVVVTMGGGYPDRLTTLIAAHTNTFKVAKSLIS